MGSLFSADLVYGILVLVFPDFGQIQTLSQVTAILLDVEVGGCGVGLEVAIASSVSHDKGQRVFVEHMGLGVKGDVNLALFAAGGQDAISIGGFKIFTQSHVMGSLFIVSGLLQSPSFRFSVGSIQYKKHVFLKTEYSKLYTTGPFSRILL